MIRRISYVGIVSMFMFGCVGQGANSWSETVDSSMDQYWTEDQANEILSKTLRVHLAPALDYLSAGEREALGYLLEVGQIMHRLYLDSRHPDASRSYEELQRLGTASLNETRVRLLSDLFWLSKGPVATTLNNERVPFLPVAAETKGKNVYPWGITREEVDQVLSAHPESASSVQHIRHVVRRNTSDNVSKDLEMLKRFPVLAELHPGLESRLQDLRNGESVPSLYGLPYSVAYAPDIVRAYRLLHRAADAIVGDDPAFARFLRNRARDFLSDDYESGDASWVTGRFRNLNAQIGSYETYDDALFGIKTFFSLCVFVRDNERSAELSNALSGIQFLEDSLPYESTRKIDDNVPVGVYNVVADFGQSRGANTATILPNEAHLSTQYGRTILIRGNILSNPDIFATARISFEAATNAMHHADLTSAGNLYRTFWHEVGHYLGPVRTLDGRNIEEALGKASNALEEMKSDLISLFAVPHLLETGFYDEQTARSVYASGIRRILLKNKPRREQDYNTMKLIQFNWFIEHGLLRFDEENETLMIDFSKYHSNVEGLLTRVLAAQSGGNETKAEAFIEAYTNWNESVSGVIADKMKATEKHRFTMVTYDAVDQ